MSGDQFLQFDSGPESGNERIMIFSTQRNLALLRQSEDWFADGTFKTAPQQFYQLYTVHALKSNRCFPCVYALLPNKQEATYTGLFRKMLELEEGLNPRSVMLDYEKATHNAFEAVFPDTIVSGCLYHLSQAVFRRVQANGLYQRYMEDAQFALQIRMIPALAFVPADDVEEAFTSLTDHLPDEAQPIVDFFEDTYIGRPQRRQRRPAYFNVPVWNVHDRVEQHLPRTNNFVEGWHRAFQANVGAYHPSFWKFLDTLRKQEDLTRVAISQMVAGGDVPPRRRQYIDVDQRLQRIVADYNDRDILDYLRGIAHNLAL